MINIHFSRCEVEKRENVKTRKRENFAFRELHEVHNAKAFFAFSRFRVFAFLRRELHVSPSYAIVAHWVALFINGRESIEDEYQLRPPNYRGYSRQH